MELNEEQLAAVHHPFGQPACLIAGAGSGKCLGLEVPVLYYDGTTKQAQHVFDGDLLIGPDGLPRLASGITSGTEEMFEIIPVKGEPWSCNRSHILSLYVSSKQKQKTYGEFIEITLNDYLSKSDHFKRKVVKLWRSPAIEFPFIPIPVDPWFLGFWLGDGDSNLNTTGISTKDSPLVSVLDNVATSYGLVLSQTEKNPEKCPHYRLCLPDGKSSMKDRGRYDKNPLSQQMRGLGLHLNKHIPQQYLRNSIAVRRAVLAGLIDSDGYFDGGVEITTKFPFLNRDILWLTHSLGLAAYSKIKVVRINGKIKQYHRIYISGDMSELPIVLKRRVCPPRRQVKSVRVTGFKVRSLGMGKYAGFKVDHNGLFLLGDFTVTHNTATLTARVKWLIEQGIPPYRIAAVTFTTKAAGELLRRINITSETPYEQCPHVSTIHSLSLNAIRKDPEGFGFPGRITPMDDYDQSVAVKKLIELNPAPKGVELNPWRLLEKIGYHRARGVGFAVDYTDEVHNEALERHGGYHAMDPWDLVVWEKFEETKRCHPPGETVEIVAERYHCAQRGGRWFVPAKIEERPIEQIKDGDLAVSWQRKSGRTIYKGRPIKVASRYYSGDMLTISTSQGSTKVTPDHLAWVRFNEQANGKHLVYLMYRNGFGFRVGTTVIKLQGKRGTNGGLSHRMNGEGAEKGWILRVCDSNFEARIWEEIYTVKYGIPQTIYEVGNKSHKEYNRLILSVFESTSPEGARTCLRDHGLLEDYPLIQKGSDGHFYSHATFRFFKTAVCNLIPSLMSLPAKTRPTWRDSKKFGQHAWRVKEGVAISSISREMYSGLVYSLDVEIDHTYISGGVVVSNCSNLVDFDDMIWLVNRRAKNDQPWFEMLNHRFHHVLCDEVQDHSKIQWDFTCNLLSSDNLNLYVVGDLAQSVYSFQGADPKLLKDFSEGWRGIVPALYRISRNHRSLPAIIRLANKINRSMTEVIPLKMMPFRGVEGDVEKYTGSTRLVRSSTPGDVAMIIAREILHDSQLKGSGRSDFKDNAILVRSAIQVRDLEGALVRLRIPYVVRGGKGLLQTEEVKDLLSYFRLAVNHKDYTAFLRAVQVPKRGIGEVAVERLRDIANQRHGGDLLASSADEGRKNEKLGSFAVSMEQVSRTLADPGDTVESIVRLFGYKEHLAKKYSREASKVKTKCENIDRFVQLIRGLVADSDLSAEDLVFQLAMDRPTDEDEDKGAVTISTIHCSPPDEPVLTVEGNKPIASLQPDLDRLYSYIPKCNQLVGGTTNRKLGYEFSIKAQPYKGDLVVIETAESRTRVTLEHRVRVSFNENFYNKWVVYLMRRGDWWRIGICTSASKPYHPGGIYGRLSTEKADCGWILGVFKSREDALIAEMKYQTTYGVPGVCFEVWHHKIKSSQLYTLHEDLRSLVFPRAIQLLCDSGLLLDSPLYRRGSKKNLHAHCFDTVAANMLDGYMMVPVAQKSDFDAKSPCRPRTVAARVNREFYEGPVFSLDVYPHEHYISGGMVVHNSAKGLEWKRVYVTNVTEGSLPHRFSMGSPSEVEEERRLFYVACTRARDALAICVHSLEPRGPNTISVAPSRFLKELNII